jgi:hypothetical protein
MRTPLTAIVLTLLLVACAETTSPNRILRGDVTRTEAYADENAGCPYYDPYCNVEPLSVQEEQAVQAQIDHIWHWDSRCMDLKMELQMKLWSGNIRRWENDFWGLGDYHVAGPIQGQIHLYQPLTLWAQGNLGWTMVHEAAHSRFGAADNTGYQDASWWANYCWMGD